MANFSFKDVSDISALISAIGGLLACAAAFKSADHAKNSLIANQLAEKRLVLRQLSITAHEVVVHVDRITWVAQGLKSAYSELAMHHGQLGSSIEKRCKSEVESKIEDTKPLLLRAKSFVEFQTHLLNGPLEEISKREVEITQCLNQAKAILEKLNIELLEISTQNQSHTQLILNKIV
jgi:hypothetical protein